MNNTSNRIRPVILAGGSGSRLWPMSTAERPKHLIPLIGELSLFEQTLERFSDRGRFAPPIIVANQAQASEMTRLLNNVDGARLILEPMKRDSAPAIALAALVAEPEEMMLVSPSDHHIANLSAFLAAVDVGRTAAEAGDIVTFGVEPDHPATGFGYIAARAGRGVRRIKHFIEKPDLDHARDLLQAGGHYWNAGIFLARASDWLCAIERHVPDIKHAADSAIKVADRELFTIRPGQEEFARSPSQSIDYAVMEKEAALSVVPVSMGWSDIGSWEALLGAAIRDPVGNSVSPGNIAFDSADTLIRSSGPRVAAIGVEGLVIVATNEAVLVVPRQHAQRVREASAWYEGEMLK